MYRIALIQNESEMMRYGWADVTPSIMKFKYRVDTYTSENIQVLFLEIKNNTYDAVIVAMNACLSQKILKELLDQKNDALKLLLNNGKGLYIGYQARIDELGFLPDKFKVNFEDRSGKSIEGTLEASINSKEYPFLSFPKHISIKEITNQCRNNNRVEGIYWSHIIPSTKGIYESIIVDTQYDEDKIILCVTRSDIASRVVISTLPIEWQGHDDLWENAIRYTVEGRPLIAIATHHGSTTKNFNYLLSNVALKKLVATEYKLNNLDEINIIPPNVHKVLVIDPSWNENDIFQLNSKFHLFNDLGFSKVFYFRKTPQNDVNTLSEFSDFDRITKNSITWLVNSYQAPYWDKSFWTTVDVLGTLKEFGRPISHYVKFMFEEIDSKHDIDGSYDEVVGATCGLLQMYFWTIGKEDPRYIRTLKWLNNNLAKKTIDEQATALTTLIRLEEKIPEDIKRNFHDDIVSRIQEIKNVFSLNRYIETLLTCGYIEDARRLALNLESQQSKYDGSWINVSNTALITLTLIELQNRSKHPDPQIDKMIYKGIIHLKSTYSEERFNWNYDDHLATATSLRALKAFEEQIEFPIDELLISLESESSHSKKFIAIDAATKMNVELQLNNNRLKNKINADLIQAKKQIRSSNFSKKLSIWSSSILLFLISIVFYLIGYSIKGNTIDKVYQVSKLIIADTYKIFIPVTSILPLILIVVLLEVFDMLPDWFDRMLTRMGIRGKKK